MVNRLRRGEVYRATSGGCVVNNHDAVIYERIPGVAARRIAEVLNTYAEQGRQFPDWSVVARELGLED